MGAERDRARDWLPQDSVDARAVVLGLIPRDLGPGIALAVHHFMIKAPGATPSQPSAIPSDSDPLAAPAQTRPMPPFRAPPDSERIQLADGSVNAAGKPSPYGLSPAQWELIRSGKLK